MAINGATWGYVKRSFSRPKMRVPKRSAAQRFSPII